MEDGQCTSGMLSKSPAVSWRWALPFFFALRLPCNAAQPCLLCRKYVILSGEKFFTKSHWHDIMLPTAHAAQPCVGGLTPMQHSRVLGASPQCSTAMCWGPHPNAAQPCAFGLAPMQSLVIVAHTQLSASSLNALTQQVCTE